MILEHCAGYPCCCFIRMHFEGRVDRDSFTNALRSALEFHPLLRAMLRTQRAEYWIFPVGIEPHIRWCEGETGGPLPQAEEIDLHRETGLKTFVVQDHSNAEVTLQFHHACCDGGGIDRFAEDVLINYARLRENDRESQHPATVDINRLATRGSYGLRFATTLKIMPSQLVGLLGAAQFWGRQPKPVLHHRARDRDTVSSKRLPSSTAYRFDKTGTLALRKAAIRQKVTVHELLVRDYFLALWSWQKKHDQYDDQAWIRMMVPMNMRDATYRSLPAMNYVSSIFLDRRGIDAADQNQLLTSIQTEMAVIRKFQLRYTFLFLLGMLNRIPTALRKSVQRDQCKTSVIFSNTGKSLRRCPLPREAGCVRAGDILLVDIDGLAPLRPYNCVTMLTLEYAHQLKLNLHYDAEFVNLEDAQDLMDLFVSRLNDTIEMSIE